MIAERQLRRGTHRSTRQHEDDIRSYDGHTNNSTEPFVWTKTANDLLESIDRHCQRISDSGR